MKTLCANAETPWRRHSWQPHTPSTRRPNCSTPGRRPTRTTDRPTTAAFTTGDRHDLPEFALAHRVTGLRRRNARRSRPESPARGGGPARTDSAPPHRDPAGPHRHLRRSECTSGSGRRLTRRHSRRPFWPPHSPPARRTFGTRPCRPPGSVRGASPFLGLTADQGQCLKIVPTNSHRWHTAAHTRRPRTQRTRWWRGLWAPHKGCPRQDSNLRTRLRRPLLYPLSYGGVSGALLGGDG